MIKYKFISHTADIKFKAYGKNIKEVFINSALALKEAITDKIQIKKIQKKKIKVKGEDLESLLYNFLEEFLFLLDANDFIIEKIENLKINKKNFTISADVLGDKASNYEFTNNVKAITFNEMKVKKEKDKWIIQVVLDV